MSNKKLDWDKPLQTRNGRKVRIYCRDAGGEYPVHGAIRQKNGDKWLPRSWTADGVYAVNHEDPEDLINVPEEQLVNLYLADKFPGAINDQVDVIGMAHCSRDDASFGAGWHTQIHGYLGTVRIQNDEVVGFEVFGESGDD